MNENNVHSTITGIKLGLGCIMVVECSAWTPFGGQHTQDRDTHDRDTQGGRSIQASSTHKQDDHTEQSILLNVFM